MEYVDLKNEILELIERHTEGEYWDFKQQWHSNNADLIHDIICMANSLANRDCYIIIGVEDKTYNVLGVSGEKRKNQQNVINLLQQKPSWAGGYVPEVYVKTISIEDKEIDIVVIKQSDNTPFYLLEDYKKEGQPIFKGAIYTRKGDTNTPKTETADLYDTELLWKRRFGLLYNPSQRAKFYLRDLDNWEEATYRMNKRDVTYRMFYKPDPDYTIDFVNEKSYWDMAYADDIYSLEDHYYLFAFGDVDYHVYYLRRSRVILYYKDVSLFSNIMKDTDLEGTNMISPNYAITGMYYIQDDFTYLMFEFVFAHWPWSYAKLAKEIFLRVIPVYRNEKEHNEFIEYVQSKGFRTNEILNERIEGEALIRLKNTSIDLYDKYGTEAAEYVAKELKENKDLVINFASLDNEKYNQITEYLRKGKMLVDWLEEWRHFRSDN